jgi:hypothetical protein
MSGLISEISFLYRGKEPLPRESDRLTQYLPATGRNDVFLNQVSNLWLWVWGAPVSRFLPNKHTRAEAFST